MDALLDAVCDADALVRRRAVDAIYAITGIGLNFPPGEDAARRRVRVERFRALWPKMQPDIEAHFRRQETE